MSEWSDSYHIRTDEPDVTVQKLVDAGIVGWIFTPKNGWLTFVPYDPDDEFIGGGLTDKLIVISGKAVLNYNVQDVICWSFEYKTPDAMKEPRPPNSWFLFMYWWDRDEVERDEKGDPIYGDFDHAAFCRALGRPDIESEIKQIVQSEIDVDEADQDKDSHGFAPAADFGRVLGLPVYEYVAFKYLQHDPEGFIEYGLQKIGTHPLPVLRRVSGSVPKAGQSATAPSKKPGGVLGLLRLLKGGKD